MASNGREKIKKNLEIIFEKIEKAKNKSPFNNKDITIIAVTKTATVEDIQNAFELGITHFGENRIELFKEKIDKLMHIRPMYHMIGTIQRRKIPEIIKYCHFIDSVDRIEVAETLSKRAQEFKIDKIPILIQLNLSKETTKHGFFIEDFEIVYEKIITLPKLAVRGLMTIAPLNASEKELRAIFSTLRSLVDKYKLQTASMGMSDDFEIAIEEGATEIRLGRAIFN